MDIRDPQIAKGLIKEIESSQFIERRKDEYKAYKVAEGGQRTYILEELQTLFPKSWETMRVSDISVSNKILSKVSKSYKESPIRTFGAQTDELDMILEEGCFDDVMAELDRDFNRQRYCLLWVNRIEDEMSFHSLKGFESFVKIDPLTGKVIAVVINYPNTDITSNRNSGADGIEQALAESQDDTSAESRVYAMWTADYHSVWIVERKRELSSVANVPIEGNEGMVNDLGVLPFVFRSKTSSPDLPFLNQLTDQSITFNILNSDMLTASALQGYAQLVVSLPEDMSIETMHSGMTTAIHLPIVQGADSQADAKYINPNPDLAGMKETIESYAMEILSEHGIQSQSVNGNKFSSGLERLIANADVSDQIRSNQMTYAKMEKEVVEILQAYEVLRPSVDELITSFSKPKVMISDAETLQNIKTRIELGLITKIEALQIIDPNLDDEAALERLEKINEEKQENINSFMGGMDGSEEKNEEEVVT